MDDDATGPVSLSYRFPKTNNVGFVRKLAMKKKYGPKYKDLVRDQIGRTWYVPKSFNNVVKG